jgi:hypothetical protein
MVLCGVLNVDTLTDFLSPVELVCLQIHSTVLEAKYKIRLGGRVGGSELL